MESAKEQISIGVLSKRSEIGIETIRYYERLGVLAPVFRKESGYRIFDGDSVRTLHFVKHAQELGFSLSEIKDLLQLKADKRPRCQEVQRKAEVHLKDVEEKINRLMSIRSVLSELVGQCRDRKTDDRCPILECFDDYKLPKSSARPPGKKKQMAGSSNRRGSQ